MNIPSRRSRAVVACVILIALGPATSAADDMQFNIVAQSGDTAPDGDGVFSGFDNPVLNNDGLAAIEGFLTGTNAFSGLFLGDGLTDLRQIVRAGEATPDGNGVYNSFLRPAINGNGQVSFQAFLRNTDGGITDDHGVYRADGVTSVVQLVREGAPAPNGDGTIGFSQDRSALNASGLIAFQAGFNGTAGGVNDNGGVVRTDENGAVLQVAREGDPAPDGVGMFETFNDVTMNDAGQVAFDTSLTNAGNTVIGIFVGDGVDPVMQIARAGQAIPDGSANFDEFNDPEINNAGQVVFTAFLEDFRQFPRDHGIYLSDGSGGLAQIARFGDFTPDGTATFNFVSGGPSLNDAGDVVFTADVVDAATGTDRSVGLYRGRSADTIVEILGQNEAAPNGNGTFNAILGQVAVNESAQVAFHGSLTNTNGANTDDTGIFFHDDTLGLVTVIREGDPFLGSTILRVNFGRSSSIRQDEYSGLNDRGEVAFSYTLLNGDQGVAIWTVACDAVPPSITITSPADDALVESSTIVVQGFASDDIAVASVSVNGAAAGLASANNPNDPVEVIYEATIPLALGENEITAIAFDDDGSSASASIRVTRTISAPEPRDCDATGDDLVDRSDIGIIFGLRGSAANGSDDPLDVNNDGLITINDGRLCVLQCDNPHCAPTL